MAKLSATDHEYRRTQGAVSSINYHFVFVPKRRKALLVSEVARELQAIVFALAQTHGWKLLAQEIMPDHIHLLINAPTVESAAQIARWIKGRTSRDLRQHHPTLKRLPCLWSPSYFVATTGQVSTATIQKYIENQKHK